MNVKNQPNAHYQQASFQQIKAKEQTPCKQSNATNFLTLPAN